MAQNKKFNFRVFALLTVIIVYCASSEQLESPMKYSALAQEKKINTNDTLDKNKNDIIIVKETKDTVYVLNKSSINKVKKTIGEQVQSWHTKGIGFSGGFLYGVFAIRMTPVEEYIKTFKHSNSQFKISSLNIHKLSYEPFFMSGGMFYVGIGNGLRIGGYGIKGSNFFHGENSHNDSSYVNVRVGFGGLLIEKAYVRKKWNGKVSGIIGGGNMTITHGRKLFDNPLLENEAGFFCLEIHSGMSYSFFSLFHIGLDVSLPAFFMYEGFPSYTNDFYTLNSGFTLKIIIGNLG